MMRCSGEAFCAVYQFIDQAGKCWAARLTGRFHRNHGMTTTIKHKIVTAKSEEIDLGRIYGGLLDHRKLIIGVTSVVTLLAIIYALFITPVYQANAMIQIEQKQ
jgi:hypothetical protein